MTLLESAERQVKVLSAKALDEGLRQARLMAMDCLDPIDAADVVDALEIIEQHRGAIEGMAAGIAVNAVAMFSVGREPALIEASTTYEQRRALHHASTDAAIAAADEARERLEALKALGLALGKVLATKVLPFLLACL